MTVLRSLWASVQGDPVFMRKFNGWCVIFFFAFWMLSTVTGWVHSVTLISHLSFIALILGSLSAWQAARVEVKQEEQDSSS
jgi:hypothetical protein